jgi:hypothetical protein
MKIKVKLILDDWRDKKDLTKSVYNTNTGVELTMSGFYHGSVFDGEIEVNEKSGKFLTHALKDGWSPVFIVLDSTVKNWRWS